MAVLQLIQNPPPPAVRPRILVYEDETPLRNAYRAILRQMHLEVDATDSFLEACELVEEKSYTLAIIDIQDRAGAETGLDLIDKITRISPATKIVVISAYGGYRDIVVDQFGAQFVHKLFNMSEIVREIGKTAVKLFHDSLPLLGDERWLQSRVEAVTELYVDVSCKDPVSGWMMLALPRRLVEGEVRVADELALIARFAEDGGVTSLRIPLPAVSPESDPLAKMEEEHDLADPDDFADPLQARDYRERLDRFFNEGKS